MKVVHVRDGYDVYIPGKWGYPFQIGTREEVLAKHMAWIRSRPELLAALPELKGKRLGCSPLACHGDNLIALLGEQDGIPV